MVDTLWKHIQTVKENTPLVQSITNYVVMNNTANALLAAGASPIMAHAEAELEEMISICQALVINIGTLDEQWSPAMVKAAKIAKAKNKPFVVDPVGAGATTYRNTILADILQHQPTVIRGNASEILALANNQALVTKGVDATTSSKNAIEAGRKLHKELGAVICVSGETDIVISDQPDVYISNGDALMTKVTGLGCSATALIAAFIAVIESRTEAVTAAAALMAICGELAAKIAQGPGSLQMHLLDKLHNITETEFRNTLNIEQH